MLRMSTRGRYALRAMVDLALHADEGMVPRQDVAERQELSADYITKLFRDLRAAGLVVGMRGRGGGYRVARDVATISAGDVIRAAEGPLAVVHCVLPNDEPACSRVDRCVTHLVWRDLSETVTAFLDSVTLEKLCDQAQQLDGESGVNRA